MTWISHWEPPRFLESDFGAFIDFSMFPWAELKYGNILAVGGRGSELRLLKIEKKTEYSVSLVLQLVMYAGISLPWSNSTKQMIV